MLCTFGVRTLHARTHRHGGHCMECTNLQQDDLQTLSSAGAHSADYEQDAESLNPDQPRGSHLS